MKLRKLKDDDDAVSISIGFILTFSITVLMLVTILSSFYTLMDQAEQKVMRDEFEIHGNDIAVRIATIDTMVGCADDSGSHIWEVRYELSLPQKIAGKPYSIKFDNSSADIVFVSEERENTKIKVPYYADNTIVISTTLHSPKGEYLMTYSPATNSITIS
ncbi:hypothetical protein [Methanolobus sp. WCC5]|jgi:hypothetical protein|uniref:DUF7266 family protein n=1 Tax=Methanolobus sp. WCC5 TaxID=3125785 RepID=UPI00324466DF